MALIIRIDVDRPYGKTPVARHVLSRLSSDYYFPKIKSLGYLRELKEMLTILNERRAPAYVFFRQCTLPSPEIIELLDQGGHEIGLHLENSRTFADFEEERAALERHIGRKVKAFSKHGSGTGKFGRNHYPPYESEIYLEWARLAEMKIFLGNLEDPRLRPVKVNGSFIAYPSAFWLEPHWRDTNTFTIPWLQTQARQRDVVLLLHPENVLANPELTEQLKDADESAGDKVIAVNEAQATGKRVLMIAYTNYEIDPRVIREAEAAVSGGFEVDFFALRRENDPPVQEIRGVRVLRLNQRRYRGGGTLNYILAYLQFFLRCMFKSIALYPSRRYRVVHVNNMPDFLVFCTLPLKLLGVKVILDIHDPMPDTFVSKFKNGEAGVFYKLLLWQERLSARYADRVLTVHDPVKEGVLVKHGHAPESITVVANFADEDLFQLRDCPPVNGKVRMVFHGTILERYGLGNLITALSQTRNRDRIALKIIGEGDFSLRLKEMIESLGVQDSVQFVNRAFPLHEMPAMLADCHFGIVPLEISAITNYALPLKLMEYVSMGLPVVTVKNAAISYYFTENDCLFFQPNDVESLRKVLDRVAENPELLAQCRERVVALREKFFWSHEKRKYINLLNELAARN